MVIEPDHLEIPNIGIRDSVGPLMQNACDRVLSVTLACRFIHDLTLAFLEGYRPAQGQVDKTYQRQHIDTTPHVFWNPPHSPYIFLLTLLVWGVVENIL